MSDLIERQAAYTTLTEYYHHTTEIQHKALREALERVPSAQPETHGERTETHACDCIDRQAAIEALDKRFNNVPMEQTTEILLLRKDLRELPSAQPERRCVNCGRTVNNGGWYEDGRTRCPIEEHYALPKDGYCHLWEKRKDWEDNYVKRAEEGEK